MTKYQSNKFLTLAALAVVMGMTATTNSYAAGLGAYGGPNVPSTTTAQPSSPTTAEANALHEWHDDVIKNDKMRQRMALPPSGTSQAPAQAATQDGALKQLQDETVKNNAMRNRMGLSQQ